MLALAMAVAVPAVAQEPVPEVPAAKRVVIRTLELTEQQVADWEAVWTTRRNVAEPLREELRSVRGEIRGLLEQPGADSTKVGELVIRAKGLEDGIAAANQSYAEGFEALLDAGQAAKLAGIRKAARVAPVVPSFVRAGLVERRRR